MRKRRFLLIFAVLTAVFFTSCSASAEENDSTQPADIEKADIILLSNEIGLEYSEAEEIYSLLIGSGMQAGIKYVTAWNDADTGEIYYRVRTDTEKREVYLYSDEDGIAVRITDGDIEYTNLDAETVASVTDTEKVTEPTETAFVTEAITDREETEGATDTEEIVEKETEAVTDAKTVTETDVVTDTEEIPETERETIEIVLNKNTKKYHYPTCRSVSQMKEKNRETVYVIDISELFDMGYEPCGNCAKKDKR